MASIFKTARESLTFLQLDWDAVVGKNDRFVVKRGDQWAVVKPQAKRASALTDTQRQGKSRAKEIVKNLGGGEVRVQNRQGQFCDSDTVAPGGDPNPPKDKKH